MSLKRAARTGEQPRAPVRNGLFVFIISRTGGRVKPFRLTDSQETEKKGPAH